MDYGKWKDYLSEQEIEGPVEVPGKIISKDTSDDFTEGDHYELMKDPTDDCKGLPKSLKIMVPDDKADFVGVNPVGPDDYRKVSAGDIKKCYTKVAKKEKDEMMLGEMCGGDHSQPAMMPVSNLKNKMHHDDTRRVVPHDEEGRMAKSQLYKIAKYAMEMMENLHDDDELEGWVQSKITKAASYMSAAKHYLEYEYKNPPMPDEYAPMMESSKKKVDDIVNEVSRLKKKLKLPAKA